MTEHLVVVSPRTLRRLLRRSPLVWTRRRREVPVGRVHAGDTVFFKHAGRPVSAVGTVARVREARVGRRYVLTLKLRKVRKLFAPFPVVKRDRRSWVVCAAGADPRQQRLLGAASPTIADLLHGLRARRGRLPGRRAVRELLAATARQPSADTGILLWLSLFAAAAEDADFGEVLRGYLQKPSSRVFPFAVFS